jgi:hypothetical protein
VIKNEQQDDDLTRASHCQPVHRMSIMAVVSVVLKLLLDNVNEPSRHCRNSNSIALVFKSTRGATAYLLMLCGANSNNIQLIIISIASTWCLVSLRTLCHVSCTTLLRFIYFIFLYCLIVYFFLLSW